MAKILFSTTHAKADNGHFQVVFHLDGRADPFPRRLVETNNTAEALALFENYKAEAAATGAPMVATMKIHEGRAPNGFKKATAGHSYFHRINV